MALSRMQWTNPRLVTGCGDVVHDIINKD